MKDVLELVQSLQNANFKDEQTVRNVVRRVGQIANRPISKEMENKLVQTILADGKKLDFTTLANMLKKQ